MLTSLPMARTPERKHYPLFPRIVRHCGFAISCIFVEFELFCEVLASVCPWRVRPKENIALCSRIVCHCGFAISCIFVEFGLLCEVLASAHRAFPHDVAGSFVFLDDQRQFRPYFLTCFYSFHNFLIYVQSCSFVHCKFAMFLFRYYQLAICLCWTLVLVIEVTLRNARKTRRPGSIGRVSGSAMTCVFHVFLILSTPLAFLRVQTIQQPCYDVWSQILPVRIL